MGPTPHLPLPSARSVAVGTRKTGPAPQTTPEADGAFGEKKRLWTVSPRPNWLVPGPVTSFWAMMGRMVREMMFQSVLRETGMTGWTLAVKRKPSPSAP